MLKHLNFFLFKRAQGPARPTPKKKLFRDGGRGARGPERPTTKKNTFLGGFVRGGRGALFSKKTFKKTPTKKDLFWRG